MTELEIGLLQDCVNAAACGHVLDRNRLEQAQALLDALAGKPPSRERASGANKPGQALRVVIVETVELRGEVNVEAGSFEEAAGLAYAAHMDENEVDMYATYTDRWFEVAREGESDSRIISDVTAGRAARRIEEQS